MVSSLLLLHGPNLNLLGEREPAVYGHATLDDYIDVVRMVAGHYGVAVDELQSNHEGVLVDAIQRARGRHDAIVINPGALTHYAWSLHDALAAFEGRVIELHISNPNAREPWRHTSVVASVATGSIVGLGKLGYELATQAAIGVTTFEWATKSAVDGT